MLTIEGDTITAVRFLARRMAERRAELPFAEELSTQVVLVPIPRAGLRRKDALWPAFELAQALFECGFGGEIRDLLGRVMPVQKAATAAARDRPTARQHHDSMAVEGTAASHPIVLVDDVVTRGATLLGAASRLRASLPNHAIFGFAAARTISVGEITDVFDPVSGTVECHNEQTFRAP